MIFLYFYRSVCDPALPDPSTNRIKFLRSYQLFISAQYELTFCVLTNKVRDFNFLSLKKTTNPLLISVFASLKKPKGDGLLKKVLNCQVLRSFKKARLDHLLYFQSRSIGQHTTIVLVSQVVSASDSHAGSPRFDPRGWQKKFAEQGLLICGVAAHASQDVCCHKTR